MDHTIIWMHRNSFNRRVSTDDSNHRFRKCMRILGLRTNHAYSALEAKRLKRPKRVSKRTGTNKWAGKLITPHHHTYNIVVEMQTNTRNGFTKVVHRRKGALGLKYQNHAPSQLNNIIVTLSWHMTAQVMVGLGTPICLFLPLGRHRHPKRLLAKWSSYQPSKALPSHPTSHFGR